MVFVILFFTATCLPFAVMMLGLDRHSLHELQSDAAANDYRSGIAAQVNAYRKYFEEHFGFRRNLILLNGLVKVKALGVSSSPDVVLGKDGWLFLGEEKMYHYRNLWPYRRSDLEEWRRNLEKRRDLLAKDGVPYIVTVAPDAQSIYPEYVPDAYNRVVPYSRMDQLIAYMRLKSDFEIVDLRPALEKVKWRERIYRRYDTHWNSYGAFVAYEQVAGEMKRYFPPVRVRRMDEFRRVKRILDTGDLARMLGIQGTVREADVALEPMGPGQARVVRSFQSGDMRVKVTECDRGEITRAVILHDSFMKGMMPFLAQHFRTAVFISEDDMEFYTDVFKKFRPNVVIQEFVERKM